MNSRRRGEDLLPRLAPVARSVARPRSSWRQGGGREAGLGLILRGTAIFESLLPSLLRGLRVLPVLEMLGIAVLVYLLGR